MLLHPCHPEEDGGKELPGNIIKVDGVPNHRIDTGPTDHIAEELGRCFNMNTVTFLEDALSWLGLSCRKANEFIVYWLPRMEENLCNRIAFQSDASTEYARLAVTRSSGQRLAGV